MMFPGQLVMVMEAVAITVAVLGGLTIFFLRNISHRVLCSLISLAAGALLSVVVLEIIPEAISSAGLLDTALGAISGYAVFYLIGRFIFHICPACAATHKEAIFLKVTLTMIVALSIHSFMDGMAIFVGYGTYDNVGLLIFFAVSYHKFPEGLALASVARGSGFSRRKALGVTAFIEAATTASGGIAGITMLFGVPSTLLGFILGHVGGGFLYLVAHALVGEMIKHEKKESILTYLALGFGTIAAAGFIVESLL